MLDQRALFQYRAALDAIRPLLRTEGGGSELRNRARLLEAIADVAPEQASGPALQRLSANVIGTVGGARFPFLIDTGASFSVLTRSAAKTAHLPIRRVGYEIQSGEGLPLRTDVAVGDLTLEKTSLHHIVFLIVPDGNLAWNNRSRRAGLLGLPELRRIGTVHFTSARKRLNRSATPLRFNAGQLSLEGVFEGAKIRCGVDTGANRTVLYAGFWNRFGSQLTPSRHRMSVRTVGGSSSALYQAEISFTVAGTTIPLQRAVIFKRRINSALDCALGADAIAALASVTLDFDHMMLTTD